MFRLQFNNEDTVMTTHTNMKIIIEVKSTLFQLTTWGEPTVSEPASGMDKRSLLKLNTTFHNYHLFAWNKIYFTLSYLMILSELEGRRSLASYPQQKMEPSSNDNSFYYESVHNNFLQSIQIQNFPSSSI